MPRLAASQLACRRGTRLLFKGLDLVVEAGQIVWVRGRNGRGKTSLLRLAAGLSVPDDGQVLWGETPVRRASGFCERLVFIGHANALKDDLTVTEALALLLHLHGRPHHAAALHAALERMGLHSRRDAMVLTLSQGQRRRVALARLAAEREASLWILDEPFDALDVDGVQRLNDLLVEHRERGGSILLTSHRPLADALLHAQQVDLDAYEPGN
ncbi:MAG TPA: cytochrome c biogenesis heme-transporting ATPase CcmA [Rhizobacter sp.]|nr:cytochrome c biogenesis heme-transporting ATPase CcmA [Rhizobacter sp.]